MPKPDLPEPLAALEAKIIKALVDGHHEWRHDLPFPESYSDMQGAARGLLKRFAMLDLGGSSELRLRVGTLLQLHWKTLTNEQLDAIKAICDRGEGAPCDGRHRHPKRSCPQGCWDRYNAGESTYPEKDATDPRIAAWRVLAPETRAKVLANLRQDWPPYDARDHAAAALEALGEK